MRDQLVNFIATLRHAGLNPSPSESLDAVAAVAVAGVECEVLRESLAATLVKEHSDRPVFDDLFDRFFLPQRPKRRKREQRRSRGERTATGTGTDISAGMGAGKDMGRVPGTGKQPPASPEKTRRQPNKPDRAPMRGERTGTEEEATARRCAARRLRETPFRAMVPEEAEEARELVEELARQFRARWSRRLQRSARGRLDMRRTLRRSMSRGGVPVELLWRKPRPGRSNLFALVDLSYSTAAAAQFLLSLLAPAHAFFRRITLLAYVDTPVEIVLQAGDVIPQAPLDLNARSDFGKVLRHVSERYESYLTRDTILLVLGDARNNRRPPRADLLARLHARVRTLVWLNPEPPERWNTGDSVMGTYARHADLVLAAYNLATLVAAVNRLRRLAA